MILGIEKDRRAICEQEIKELGYLVPGRGIRFEDLPFEDVRVLVSRSYPTRVCSSGGPRPLLANHDAGMTFTRLED